VQPFDDTAEKLAVLRTLKSLLGEGGIARKLDEQTAGAIIEMSGRTAQRRGDAVLLRLRELLLHPQPQAMGRISREGSWGWRERG
jgi:hypothetical protein